MDADLGDVEWRELEDLYNEPSVDALHVHLNGDLVDPTLRLPALPALDSAIPLTLALSDIKHESEDDDLDPSLSDVSEDVVAQLLGDTDVKPISSPQEHCTPKSEPMNLDPEPIITEPVTTPPPPSPLLVQATPKPEATVVPAAEPLPAAPVTSPRVAAGGAPPRRARPDPASPPPTPAASPATPPSAPAASVSGGRVEKGAPGKIGSLREKRAREAAQFPRALLRNLSGTTSAEVRKMSTEERALVLFKRKLRNRESARRSRQKRQATLSDLHDELAEVATVAARMVDIGAKLHATNSSLRNSLDLANAQIRALRAAYEPPSPTPSPPPVATVQPAPVLTKDVAPDRIKMKIGA